MDMSGLGALAALVATAPTRSETPTHLWGEVVATDPPTVILEHDDTAEPREVASVAVSRLAVGSRVRLELLGQRLTILGPEAPAPAASRGSNGNGHWWRDPSGLQVCWVEIQGVGGTNPYASLHLASSLWNFPLPFLSPPVVTCGRFQLGTGAAWPTSPTDITALSARLRALDAVARPAGTPVFIQATAVGLWR